ncbi:hypothetical protein JTE90_024147 [Oedothorax gibbosus]|nr:hypothetical protein JTE90_024147 [Oedothorax gibbosus]
MPQACSKLPKLKKKSKSSQTKARTNTIEEYLPIKKKSQISYNFRNKNANKSPENKFSNSDNFDQKHNESVREEDQKCSFCEAFNPYVGSARTCFSCGLKCSEQRTSTTFTSKPQNELEVIDAYSRTEALPFSHINSTKDVHLPNTVQRSSFTKSRRVKAPVKYGQESSPLKRIKLRREIETDILLINKTVIAEPKLNESSINETVKQVPKVCVPPKLNSKSCTPDIRSINDCINQKRAPVVDLGTKKSALEKDIELISKKQVCSRLFVPADVLKEITYDNSVREDAINADKSSSENCEEIIDVENIEGIPVVNFKNSTEKVCAAKMTHNDKTMCPKRTGSKKPKGEEEVNVRKRRHSKTYSNGGLSATQTCRKSDVVCHCGAIQVLHWTDPPNIGVRKNGLSEAVSVPPVIKPDSRVARISSFIKTTLSKNLTRSPDEKSLKSSNSKTSNDSKNNEIGVKAQSMKSAENSSFGIPLITSKDSEKNKSPDILPSNIKNGNLNGTSVRIMDNFKLNDAAGSIIKSRRLGESVIIGATGKKQTKKLDVQPSNSFSKAKSVKQENSKNIYLEKSANRISETPVVQPSRSVATRSETSKAKNQYSAEVSKKKCTKPRPTILRKNFKRRKNVERCDHTQPASVNSVPFEENFHEEHAKSSNFPPSNVILETDKATKSLSPSEEAPVTLEISSGEEDSNSTVTADSEDFISEAVEDSPTPPEPISPNPDDVTLAINSEILMVQSQEHSQPTQATPFEAPLPSPSVDNVYVLDTNKSVNSESVIDSNLILSSPLEEVTLQEDSQQNLSKRNNANQPVFEKNSAVQFYESVLSTCSNEKFEEMDCKRLVHQDESSTFGAVSTCYERDPLTNHAILAAHNNEPSTVNIKYVSTLEQENEDSLIIESDAVLGPESVLSNHSEESANEIEINFNKLMKGRAFSQIDSDETINNITVPLCAISKVDSNSVNAKIGEKEEWPRNEETLCLLNTEFSTAAASTLSKISPHLKEVSTIAEPMYEGEVELQPVESPKCVDSKIHVSNEVDKKSLNLNVHSVSKNAEVHGTMKIIIALPAINKVDSDSVEEEECSADEDFTRFSRVSNTDTTDEFLEDSFSETCMESADNYIHAKTHSKLLDITRRRTGLCTMEPQFGAPGIPNKRLLVETSNFAEMLTHSVGKSEVRLDVLRSNTNLIPITSNSTELFLNSNNTNLLAKNEVFKPLVMPKASTDAVQNSLNTELTLAIIEPNISSCLETLSSINEDEPPCIDEFESNAEGNKCSGGPEIPLEDLKESETFLKGVEGPEIILKNLESPELCLKDLEGSENFWADLEQIKNLPVSLLEEDFLTLFNTKHSVIQNTLQELGVEKKLINERCQEAKELEPSPTTPANNIESIQHFSGQNNSQTKDMNGYSDCAPSLKRCLVTSIEGQQSIVSPIATETVKPTFKQNNFQPSEKEWNLKLQEPIEKYISEECNTVTQPIVENIEPKLSSDRPKSNIITPALSNEYSFNSYNEAEKNRQGPDLNVNLTPTISIKQPFSSINSYNEAQKSSQGPDLNVNLTPTISIKQPFSSINSYNEAEKSSQGPDLNVNLTPTISIKQPFSSNGALAISDESSESNPITPAIGIDSSFIPNFKSETGVKMITTNPMIPSDIVESTNPDLGEVSKENSLEQQDSMTKEHHGTEPITQSSERQKSSECSVETLNSSRKEHHKTYLGIGSVGSQKSSSICPLVESTFSEFQEEASKECTQQQEYSSSAPAIAFDSIDPDFGEQCIIEKQDNRKNVHNETLSVTSLGSQEPSSSGQVIPIESVALDSGNGESSECSIETQNSGRKEYHVTNVSISSVENQESIVRDPVTLIERIESELDGEASKHCVLEKPDGKMKKCLSIEPSVEIQEFGSRGPAIILESIEIVDKSLEVQEDSNMILEKSRDTLLPSIINLSESLSPNKSSEETSVLGKCSPVTTSNLTENKFCDKKLNQCTGALGLKDLHVDMGCNSTHEHQPETVSALGKRPYAKMDEINSESEKLSKKKQKLGIKNPSFALSASNSNAIVQNAQNLSTGLESKVSEKVEQLVETKSSEEEPLPIQIDSYCSIEQPLKSIKFSEETFVQVPNRPASSKSSCNNQHTAHHHSDIGTFRVPHRLLDRCSASGQQEPPKLPNIGLKKSRKKPEDYVKIKKPSHSSTYSNSGLSATQTCRKCKELLPTPLPHQVACERVDRDYRHLTADVVCGCGAKQALHWTDPPNIGVRKGKTKPRDSITGKQLLPRLSTNNSSISALLCAQKCRWCGEELPIPSQNQVANRQVVGSRLHLTSLVVCQCGAKQARHDIVSKERLADLAASQREAIWRREKEIAARRHKRAENIVKNLHREYGIIEDLDAPLANVETHRDPYTPRNCSEGDHSKVPCRDSSGCCKSLAGSASFPDNPPTCGQLSHHLPERTFTPPNTRSGDAHHSPNHPSTLATDQPAVIEFVEDMSRDFDLFQRGPDSYKCARGKSGPCGTPMAKKDIATHFFYVHHESITAFNVLFPDPS